MPDPVTLASAVGWGISVLGWVISPVISKLVNKGLGYLDVPAGSSANDLHQNLVKNFGVLTLILEKAQAVPPGGEKTALEEWVNKLKSAFYDAEIILDEIDYHRLKWKATTHRQSVNRTKKKASMTKDFNVPPGSKESLGKTLKRIEGLIDDGQKLLPLLHLTTSGDNSKSAPNHITGLLSKSSQTTSEPSKVFGRDEDTKMIISMLHDTPADDHSVIGIHGIAGSGKTTFVQYVCDCEKKSEDHYFELIMWIHVTENFSVHTIYNEMLEIASGQKMDRLSNLDMLQSKLRESLKGKRLLLVLDDVWYSESVPVQDNLMKLLSPFKEADKASRVLMTSRNADAAKLLGAQNPIPISDMDEKEFFKMFMHYALDKSLVRDQDKGKFETIGRKISMLLRKSPLAARIVAGQLKRRTSKAEDIEYWKNILIQKCDLLKDTMGALWWCYHQLEEHVRQCLAYCSMFPRRHKLYRDMLVKMWMAQGFVDIEGAAQECFEVLLSTSFIQLKPNGYYTVHDLLHDLAGIVAGSDCFRIEKGMVGHQIPQDVRHLFIDSDNPREFMEQIVKLDKLRTLVMRKDARTIGAREYFRTISAEDFERILKYLKKLRFVHVHLEVWHANVIPECIGELKHLRYLGLTWIHGNGTTDLPAAFAKLYHLQVLSISTAVRCLDSSHMADLENLQVIECSRLNIPDIGRMRWLQTLGCFKVKKQEGYEITQLENLNNIRGCLSIEGLGNIQSEEEARRANLISKLHVSGLDLDFGGRLDEETESSSRKKQKTAAGHRPRVVTPEEILEALHPPALLAELSIRNYSGSKLPSWLSGNDGTLNHLESLSFYHCRGSCSQFRFGESLWNKLRSLLIFDCSWDVLPDNNKQLPSLEKLEIDSCPNIQSIPELPSSLKELEITNCPNISTLPELPASLEELTIFDCDIIQSPPGLPSSLKNLWIKVCPNIQTLPQLPLSLELLQCEEYLVDSYPDRQAIDRIEVHYFDS